MKVEASCFHGADSRNQLLRLRDTCPISILAVFLTKKEK